MLGLLSTEQAREILFWWACVITAAIVCIVQNVPPWTYAELMAKVGFLVVVWKVLPG